MAVSQYHLANIVSNCYMDCPVTKIIVYHTFDDHTERCIAKVHQLDDDTYAYIEFSRKYDKDIDDYDVFDLKIVNQGEDDGFV